MRICKRCILRHSRNDERKFYKDFFKSGDIEINLEANRLIVTAAGNRVELAHQQLANIIISEKWILVSYNCGFSMQIPKSKLSRNELIQFCEIDKRTH